MTEPNSEKISGHKVVYFPMGHAEMAEGWSFGEPSWGIRVDEVLVAVFQDPVEAERQGHVLAEEYQTVLEKR